MKTDIRDIAKKILRRLKRMEGNGIIRSVKQDEDDPFLFHFKITPPLTRVNMNLDPEGAPRGADQ